MKHILIRGQANSGKSTTIREICELLKPDNIWQVDIWADVPKKLATSTANIQNGTYLIEVNGKFILIIAGSPTEQLMKVSEIIGLCQQLANIEIVIVAMRSFERRKGHNTPEELKKLGILIYDELIEEIKGDDFQTTPEWKNRINQLIKLVKDNL